MAAGGGFDRLSTLPDVLLCLILSLLPLDLAIRACLLSKRYRFLWTRISRIDLDENYFTQNRTRHDFLQSHRASLAAAIKSTGQAKFVDFARRFTASYPPDSDIQSLRIRMGDDSLKMYSKDVHEWLRFAVDRNVRDVDLSFFDGTKLLDFVRFNTHQEMPQCCGVEAFQIPGFFYENKHIRSLKLSATAFQPRSFTRFTSMKELSLSWIRIDQNLLDVLFANCKSLDSLRMEKCTCIEPTKFSARNNCLGSLAFEDCWVVDNALTVRLPLLRSFLFYGSMTFLILEQLFSLDEAELDFSLEEEFQPVAHHMCQMLINLESVKALTLCTYTLQVLPPNYQPFHLMKRPLNLQYLTLKTALHGNELPGIAFLVRNYPKLNTITFVLQPTVPLLAYRSYPLTPAVINGEDFWELQQLPFMCFQVYLHVVKIENFSGSKNEIDLLRYFLREARSLRKVILCAATNGLPADNNGIFEGYVAAVRQVQSFEKKSNFVEVVIE